MFNIDYYLSLVVVELGFGLVAILVILFGEDVSKEDKKWLAWIVTVIGIAVIIWSVGLVCWNLWGVARGSN